MIKKYVKRKKTIIHSIKNKKLVIGGEDPGEVVVLIGDFEEFVAGEMVGDFRVCGEEAEVAEVEVLAVATLEARAEEGVALAAVADDADVQRGPQETGHGRRFGGNKKTKKMFVLIKESKGIRDCARS